MAEVKKSKSRKTVKKQAKKPEEQFYTDVFEHVSVHGWFSLTMPQIAKAAHIRLPELLKNYPDKGSILIGFGRYVDARMAEGWIEGTEPLKDRLFDMIMQRFDVLAPHRLGVIRLMEELQSHPMMSVMLCLDMLCGFNRSMALMLEMAGLSTSHPRAIAGIIGLKIVYLSTLRSWKHDDSSDLSETMAVLDRGISRLINGLHYE